MACRLQKLVWAPVPSDAAVRESAMAQLVKVPSGGHHAELAVRVAAKGEKDKSLDLQLVVEQFNAAIQRSHFESHYPQVTGPLDEVNEVNCAIHTNRRMEDWLALRSGKEAAATLEVKKTVEITKLMAEEHVRAAVILSNEKNRGVRAWSSRVRAWLRKERLKVLSAIVNFTPTVLRKVLALFENNGHDDKDIEFLTALLFHKAADKHSKYSFNTDASRYVRSNRKLSPFNHWLNALCHAVATPGLAFGDGVLMTRILESFDGVWDNDHFGFTEDWELKVHNTGFHHLFPNQIDTSWGNMYNRFEKKRSLMIVEASIMGNNISALEALFSHSIVDSAKLRSFIGMRMATNISKHTYAPHDYDYDEYRLHDVPAEMRKYIFSPRLGKPVIRLPSMYLEPPPVTDHLTEEQQQQMLADHWGPDPFAPTPHQLRLSRWNDVAAEEHLLFHAARAHGWARMREAHLIKYIANWWSEAALRRRYHAENDEEGRPLMLGSLAGGDQTALGKNSAGGSSGTKAGVDALDDAAEEAAKRAPASRVQETEHDRKIAKKMAAMERNLIAAREQRLAAEAAAEAAKAKTKAVASMAKGKKRARG